MKGSIIILSFFILGVILAKADLIHVFFTENDFTKIILFGLMFTVGMTIGSDQKLIESLKNQNKKIILVPAATIIGSLLGAFAISYVLKWSPTDCMAVASGFGYYSLSSIFITEFKGEELGTIALMANIMREICALLLAPVFVRFFGKLAPITAGGATTMDTTLPIIVKYSGKEFLIIAIVHGFLVDFSVPFLVSLFCS
ncbi:MAG: lysine exporter LysO family protein [Bacteroidales bacterium]